MRIKNVKLVYFSPTRTSKKTVQAIADGMGIDNIEHFDLTLPDDNSADVLFSENDFIIFCMPVYAGRVPAEAVARLQRFKGSNSLAAVVVVYGNRAYEDALLELKNIAAESGCIPVAGGAFIGEHSFSSEELPIAPGRPEKEDISDAKIFGEKISTKLNEIEKIDVSMAIKVPGNFPYQEGMAPSKAAASTDNTECTMCESCSPVCPTGAISYKEEVVTDVDSCILCCACIKNCPTNARVLAVPPLLEKAKWLSENLQEPKKAETFI